jgi:hypothetical protein
MKKAIYKKLVVLLLLAPLVSFAYNNTETKQEKRKTIKKEYAVQKNASLSIQNKYGNISVTTWDRNRIEITVVITVKGNNQNAVEKKLQNINVDFNASSTWVSAKTSIEKSSWSLWGNSNNESYQINYTVKMPKSNNIILNNDYGSIIIDAIDGTTDINCDYGKIIIGELNNSKNEIELDYCSRSTIGYMKSGAINADYSKLTVDKTATVKINSDYSNIHIGEANTVTYNADYGGLRVDNVNSITGNSDYVSIRLGTLYKNLNINADYGSIKIKELAVGFNKAEISSEYVGISIGTKENNQFNFKIQLQYADFRYNKSNVELFKSIEKSSKKYYEGTYGNGKPSSTLLISSQYGGVNLKEL